MIVPQVTCSRIQKVAYYFGRMDSKTRARARKKFQRFDRASFGKGQWTTSEEMVHMDANEEVRGLGVLANSGLEL
jgi:hypothetical protein